MATTAPVLFVPERGFDDPAFDLLEADQCVQLAVLWRSSLDPAGVEQAISVASAWIRDRALWSDLEHDGVEAGFVGATSLGSWGLALTLVNVARPRPALAALLHRLEGAGVPAREVVAGVNWRDGDRFVAARPPHAGPTARALADIEAYWRAAFAEGAPPPRSEIATELGDELDGLRELRLSALHLEGLRLCYTTPTPNFLGPTARAASVSSVVGEELRRTFEPLRTPAGDPCPVPQLLDRNGAECGTAERIFRNGRVGYSLAFSLRPLASSYAASFRYREYELMLAVRAAIQRLQLEPVVLWRRFGSGDGDGHCELQVWEPVEAPASREAVGEIEEARARALSDGALVVLPATAPVTAPAPALTPGPEVGLPDGVRVISSPGGVRVALVPAEDHDGMDRLALVQEKGSLPVDVPPSACYQLPQRHAFDREGKYLFVLTDVALRAIDLASGEVLPLMFGTGYQEVVTLADGLVAVLGNAEPVSLSTAEPDVARMLAESGYPVRRDPVRCGAARCVWLVDMRSETALVQTIAGAVRQLRAVHDGRVLLAHGADPDQIWRTAVLAPRERSLRLVARLREALPDAFDLEGRVFSTNANEVLGLLPAADRADPEAAPDLVSLNPT